MVDFATAAVTVLSLLKRRSLKQAVRYLVERMLINFYRVFPHEGVEVVEEDWDYLVILDACRYDAFEAINKLPGRLEKRISLGSFTSEWARKNFKEYYGDIVYVSSNPQISSIRFEGFRGTDHFFAVVNVWDFGWDEELNTVPPSEVTKAALRAKQKYPDKRMIIHYMQPHAPWIGETRIAGRKLDMRYRSHIDRMGKLGLWKVMGRAEDMGVSLALIRKAYVDNLTLVLDEVRKLANGLEGKIVVSADHGECLGCKLLIEHPQGLYVRELVEVPWLILEKPKEIDRSIASRLLKRCKNADISFSSLFLSLGKCRH